MAKCPKCEHDEFTSESQIISGINLRLVVCKACDTVVGIFRKANTSNLDREIKRLEREIKNLKSTILGGS